MMIPICSGTALFAVAEGGDGERGGDGVADDAGDADVDGGGVVGCDDCDDGGCERARTSFGVLVVSRLDLSVSMRPISRRRACARREEGRDVGLNRTESRLSVAIVAPMSQRATARVL
jgi:hypothetical protein